jgi:predicted nucleic acid-binding protein
MEPASIPRGVIDTPILVAYREADPDAVAFITAVRATGQPEFSELSAMVLVARCAAAAELAALGWIFYGATVHRITAPISRRASRVLRSLAPPCGLTADDAVVAATAIEHTLPLYTLDPTRFAGVTGLTATRPY